MLSRSAWSARSTVARGDACYEFRPSWILRKNCSGTWFRSDGGDGFDNTRTDVSFSAINSVWQRVYGCAIHFPLHFPVVQSAFFHPEIRVALPWAIQNIDLKRSRIHTRTQVCRIVLSRAFLWLVANFRREICNEGKSNNQPRSFGSNGTMKRTTQREFVVHDARKTALPLLCRETDLVNSKSVRR